MTPRGDIYTCCDDAADKWRVMLGHCLYMKSKGESVANGNLQTVLDTLEISVDVSGGLADMHGGMAGVEYASDGEAAEGDGEDDDDDDDEDEDDDKTFDKLDKGYAGVAALDLAAKPAVSPCAAADDDEVLITAEICRCMTCRKQKPDVIDGATDIVPKSGSGGSRQAKPPAPCAKKGGQNHTTLEVKAAMKRPAGASLEKGPANNGGSDSR